MTQTHKYPPETQRLPRASSRQSRGQTSEDGAVKPLGTLAYESSVSSVDVIQH